MDILSTLKSEYSRTVIMIVIPGAIALFPFCLIIYNIFHLQRISFKDYVIYISLIYLFASVFLGFIIQDLGARLEMILDKKCYEKKDKEYLDFNETFELYLFNKKQEEFIITHYYRAMLVRLKFELHTIVAIILLLIGFLIRYLLESPFELSWARTILFLFICISLLLYLFYESIKGVETLHNFRIRINKKFNPTFEFNPKYE